MEVNCRAMRKYIPIKEEKKSAVLTTKTIYSLFKYPVKIYISLYIFAVRLYFTPL